MGIYETELGYQVRETINGLDVYEDGQLVCELSGKSLNDYRYIVGDDDDYSEINDDKLEAAIKEEIEVMEFLDDQQGNF